MLLELACKAQLPLVSVETDDPLNIKKVLNAALDKMVVKGFPTIKDSVTKATAYDPNALKGETVYVMRKPNMDKTDWEAMYAKLAGLKSTVILVNPSKERPEVFPTGFISCPESLIREFVESQSDAESGSDDFEALVSALSGLSYQSIVQIALLAQANSGQFTAASVREIRRVFFGDVRGLRQENTTTHFYSPSKKLVDWLALDGYLFADDAPDVLRSRGLLFDGPPGTGKTEGAKFLARELNLPLYRLDVGSTMNKWVGESEKGLERALAQADRCAPCVMLLDEVEKIFGGQIGSGDSGVSTRALSTLLWWLQEHKSRVLTVMTTNAKHKLPPELIREGRIDAQVYMGPLEAGAGLTFMEAVAGKHKNLAQLTQKELEKLHAAAYPEEADTPLASHAHLTAMVMGAVKEKYLSKITQAKAQKAHKEKA